MSAATRTEPVQLVDGRALRMTFAEPQGVIRGGLVVLHEERGITETTRALVIGAAVSVAGGGILQPVSPGLPALVDVASELRCPWLGLYGDKVADEVALLREAARRSETANDVVLYPAADHRFDIYPDTAMEAWQRVLNWFDAHLR
ncbi:MAG: hypothetical protein LC635_03040 [Pseudonocardiaceae bacterium]|nr:hypothetical protein [Pseudonocardiaceae bacterium]